MSSKSWYDRCCLDYAIPTDAFEQTFLHKRVSDFPHYTRRPSVSPIFSSPPITAHKPRTIRHEAKVYTDEVEADMCVSPWSPFPLLHHATRHTYVQLTRQHRSNASLHQSRSHGSSSLRRLGRNGSGLSLRQLASRDTAGCLSSSTAPGCAFGQAADNTY